MPKYVIERLVPGAGSLSDEEIREMSTTSNRVLSGMPDVQWVQSYVTDDKFFCVYLAPDPERIRQHAKEGGFPADAVREVARVIDPTSGGQ